MNEKWSKKNLFNLKNSLLVLTNILWYVKDLEDLIIQSKILFESINILLSHRIFFYSSKF